MKSSENVDLKNGKGFIALANRLFKEGNFTEALRQYEYILSNYPDLGRYVKVNIDLTKKRISLTAGNNCHKLLDKPVAEKSMPVDYNNYKISDAYKYVTEECGKYSTNHTLNVTPLVSVVMPIRNCAEFIPYSIKSLLEQSYKNIEIIVVDDFSTDNTGDVVTGLAKKDNRIRYQRVNSNLGTYFARSYGIWLAKGEYITFQDADDFSHEKRIQIHLYSALNKNVKLVTTNHVRFDIHTGKIINFHGSCQHYGFITTFAKRELFEEIGSFDLTSRGGDAEFSARIKRYLDKKDQLHLAIPTYLATDTPGSLSYGEVNRNVIDRKAALSFNRARYAKNFLALNQTFDGAQLAQLFRFPMLRSPYRLPKALANASVSIYKIVGCVCTIPERKEIFEDVFNSIISQVDILYVYPDKYSDEELPGYILDCRKVIILSRKSHPGLRDGAKFLPLQLGLFDSELSRTIVFTFDDDILYPPDYVHSMYDRLRSLNFFGVVGVHGAVIKDNFENFRTDREVINFKHASKMNRLVDVLGTGTTAFRADLLRNRFRANDVDPGLVDISLAVVCRKYLIPMLCVSRPDGWLRDYSANANSPSLWDELVQDATPHTMKLKSIGNNAWGSRALKYHYDERVLLTEVDRKVVSRKYKISKDDFNPLTWRITLSKSYIYRIEIHVESAPHENYSIELANSLSGATIYIRLPVDGHASFLCNGDVNKDVSVQIKTENNHSFSNFSVNITAEELFDACPPKHSFTNDKTITACMATYPPRENCLSDVIELVLPQVDNLCIYLNRYSIPPKPVLDVVVDEDKSSGIQYILDHGGIPKASGKFRWINCDGYIFTIDDDILYPDNYFAHLIGWIEKFKRKAFVGVHGVKFNREVDAFHTGTRTSILKKTNFSEALQSAERVHMIGTGTLGFHSSLIDEFRDELFFLMNYGEGLANANDEALAVFANKKLIPMYIVPRSEGWLRSNKKMKYGIYEEHFNDEDLSNSVVKLLATGNPWTL